MTSASSPLLAVVVCDMWDATHCVSAARRADVLATRMNDVLRTLRARDALIVHAPADCMEFYRDSPSRARAMCAPHAIAPVPFDWNDWEADELAVLPASLTDPGACSCESAAPCGDRHRVWTRQTPRIAIDESRDAITDDGQELYNLVVQHRIADVVVMGVHANLCVLGRPYGIRQLVKLGLHPLLCSDHTDAFHRDARTRMGHAGDHRAHRAAVVSDGDERGSAPYLSAFRSPGIDWAMRT